MWKKRIPLLLFVDIITSTLITLICFALMYEGEGASYWHAVLIFAPVLSASTILFMLRYNLYQRIWKYSSVGELVSIFKAVSLGVIVSGMLFSVLKWEWVDLALLLFIFQSSLIVKGSTRFALRLKSDTYNKKGTGDLKVLIIGAGDCGSMVAKEIKQNKYINNSYPVGFIDDDEQKRGNRVGGLRVLGNRNDIAAVVEKHEINHIIIALPAASKKDISEIINLCKETGCELKIVPRLDDIILGKVTASSIRNVEVEDLLGRSPVAIDLEGIANYVEGKVVLVTGAGGSIGSELCRQIAPFKPGKLLLLGHGENSIYQIDMELSKTFKELKTEAIIADVQDRETLFALFGEYSPQVVFHAAAHKHVPLMERNPKQAVMNNIMGTKNVAEACDQHGVERFVLVSTDKAVNPTSVMGATKRVAEIIVQSISFYSNTKFAAVRFGNVLGSRGSVIPLFKAQIAEGGPVTVTDPEMIRYFMTIPEASQLVVQAGAFAKGGEVFILDMDKPVKIYELAKDLIRLSGFEPYRDIDIKFTGLRPGEKMYEELLTDAEGMSATLNNRIFIGKPMAQDIEPVMLELQHLEGIIRSDLSEVKAFVKRTITSRSRNAV